jgi:hypothetical protein
MDHKGIMYILKAKPWLNSGVGGWHFISFSIKISTEIRKNNIDKEEGWGRLKALAKIGNTEWKTSIWFDTKRQVYLLPIKAEVRKKESIKLNKILKLEIWV